MACVLAGCTLPAEWMLISGSTGACYAVMGPTLDYASSITDCAGQAASLGCDRVETRLLTATYVAAIITDLLAAGNDGRYRFMGQFDGTNWVDDAGATIADFPTCNNAPEANNTPFLRAKAGTTGVVNCRVPDTSLYNRICEATAVPTTTPKPTTLLPPCPSFCGTPECPL